jgi:hypothetical protein
MRDLTKSWAFVLLFTSIALSLLASGCASGSTIVEDVGPRPDANRDGGDGGIAPRDGGDGGGGTTCTLDVDCDDHDACNGMETCTGGHCQLGTAITCDDHVACTNDQCDTGDGTCTNVPDDTLCSTGLACDRVDGCTPPRACTIDTDCDDHVFCNGVERCDLAFGCRRGEAPTCDDGQACTTDACDAVADACASTPDDTHCDDALVCNGAEVCSPTDPAADGEGCAPGVAMVCDDGITCTTDTCDEAASGCVSTPMAAACDDGVFCNGAETCDPAMGGCQPGTLPTCDDAIGCSVGRCDPTTDRCVQDPNDVFCSDSRLCNGSEHCDVTGTTAGTGCVPGATIDCSDGMSCTTDSCSEPGMCVHGGSDADRDGHTAIGCASGRDCDDLNPAINPGAAELCDGVDNDCSGGGAAYPAGVDDGAGMQCALGSGSRSCTTMCGSAGTQTCNSACRLGVCLATIETCNGCDDNGDGRIDEAGSGPGSTVFCRAGEARTCAVPGCGTIGTQTCDSSCGWGACSATEVCNTCDDDRDGVVDDGFTLGGMCSVGVGECVRTGSVVCRSDGTGTTCSASPGVPVAELCNGRDDNCNGSSDEAFTELGMACSVGVGACRRTGAFICRMDATGTACSAVAAAPGTETCNGIDDDCDGMIDDGADAGACDGTDTDLCAEGTNRCMSGTLVCDDATGNNPETCNSIDDNCNGTVDEGCACTLGTTSSCYGGPAGTAGVGLCHAGTQTCVAGPGGVGSMLGPCTGAVTPAPEVCNGQDDDCAGGVDNGNPGGGAPCDGADTDSCIEGFLACTGGSVICNDMTSSTTETCNGIDDDCTGGVDNGNPGGGVMCDGADGDSCLEGTTSCTSGMLQCSDMTTTTVEACNGLNDDCDSSIDEGNPGGGASCDGGDTDSCLEGNIVCTGGSLVCNDGTGSTTEICGNGIDDDCNGSIDTPCGPPNDLCPSATPYTLGSTVSSTTVGAVDNYSSSCGASSTSPDVVYSFFADGSPTSYRIHVDTATHDGTIHIHSASTCALGDEVACNDDFGTTRASEITLNNLAQGTYYIVVDGFSTGSAGTFTLTSSTTVLNPDTCASPAPITQNGRFIGTTAGRVNNYTPSCSSSTAPDVVYSILARTTGTITVTTCGATFDTILYESTTCGGSLVCDDDTGAGACGELTSVISFAATAGTTYYFVVDGYSTNAGPYTVEVNGY